MTNQSEFEHGWNPAPDSPSEPEFYRRVLRHLPTAVVVVNQLGEAIYTNDAMLALGGWEAGPDSDVNINILSHVHPDDRASLTSAFIEIAASPGARVLGSTRPWAEIYFRIVDAAGITVPVQVVGTGGILDTVVGGIIYEVRPAFARDLLSRLLDGLTQGASVHQLLSLVLEIITAPPLDLSGAILQHSPDGETSVAAASSPAITELLNMRSARAMHWPDAPEPTAIDSASIPAELSELFNAAGFQDLWQISVDSPLSSTRLRIVACSPTHHVPDRGPVARLKHARELASVVLLHAQTDVVLNYVASHDHLTELPNRVAFHGLLASLDPERARAALHLDLDGTKRVNAQHGLGAGDAVLQIVADRLRAIGKDQAIIGRVGDDEFTLVISHTHDEIAFEERALLLASQLQASISEPIMVAGRPILISASIGVAVSEPNVSVDHLLTWADVAMHDSKRNGGNQINRYQDSVH